MPFKLMALVELVMATIVMQLFYPSNPQPHRNSKEMTTGKAWTAYELSGIALDMKTALVVSQIVGGSPDEPGFSTNLASSRQRWEHLYGT